MCVWCVCVWGGGVGWGGGSTAGVEYVYLASCWWWLARHCSLHAASAGQHCEHAGACLCANRQLGVLQQCVCVCWPPGCPWLPPARSCLCSCPLPPALPLCAVQAEEVCGACADDDGCPWHRQDGTGARHCPGAGDQGGLRGVAWWCPLPDHLVLGACSWCCATRTAVSEDETMCPNLCPPATSYPSCPSAPWRALRYTRQCLALPFPHRCPPPGPALPHPTPPQLPFCPMGGSKFY